MQKNIIKELLIFIDNECREQHYECYDMFYNCPKSPDGCSNDSAGNECNCGADYKNEVIDALIDKYKYFL